MIFQHPLMLAWLGGAVVPLVLHLLSRSRYRPVDWGAMMFLTGIDAAAHHTAHARQWVLLFFRMATVGLLAVALARPVISSRYASVPTGGLTTGGPAAVVIILDDSASMGYEKDGKTRLDQAREVTLQILSAMKHGDQATLLVAGTRDYQQALPPSGDLQSIAARVADLQPDIGLTDFSNEILRAADLLEHAGPADHEIYIVTDHQALSWRAVNDAFKQRWSTRRSAGAPLRLTVFPVGGDEADNLSIDGFDLPDRVVVREQMTELQVRVHNYGPTAADSVPIKVWTGVRTLGETTVSVPAHGIRSVNFPVRFGEAGSKVISAALTTTGLTSDDRMDYALDVLEPPHVLLVSNQAAASQPAVGLLSLLTAPGRRGGEPAIVTPILPANLNADTLKQMTVIVLDDIAHLSLDQTRALQQFITRGGGVLFVPGDRVAKELKGNPLYQAGSELLPIMLQPPISPIRPGQGEITMVDRSNPIFRFVANRPDPFSRVPIDRFFQIGGHGREMKILGRYGSTDPFLVEFPQGRGRVMLLTTPIDASWNALPTANWIWPMLQSLLRYLSQGMSVDRNLWLGQPIIATVDEPVEDRSATVQFFNTAQREPATVTRVNDHTEIRFARTPRPGVYRLRYRSDGKEKILNYVVNTGHAESDLTPLTPDQWHTLANRANFELADLQKATVANTIDNQRGGREIWIDLLGGVVGLMMIEGFLSRFWTS